MNQEAGHVLASLLSVPGYGRLSWKGRWMMKVALFVAIAAVTSACAGSQPLQNTQARHGWRIRHEEHLYEMAKRHPNAQARARPEYPEAAPSYAAPGFRLDLKRRNMR